VKQSELQNFNSNWPQTYFSKDLANGVSHVYYEQLGRCNRASWWGMVVAILAETAMQAEPFFSVVLRGCGAQPRDE